MGGCCGVQIQVFPDFTVHYESDTIANRILIVMGEVQSSRNSATQNAVGNLTKTPRRELVVLTIFKNKSATTSVVRLRDGFPTDTLGIVTLFHPTQWT